MNYDNHVVSLKAVLIRTKGAFRMRLPFRRTYAQGYEGCNHQYGEDR